MYVTNNYFNNEPTRSSERYSQPRSQPRPHPQPAPDPNPDHQTQVRIPEPDVINRIINNDSVANNVNNIEIELNYLYNPERGRFNIIQNPNPNRYNIIDYIYNFINTGTTGVNEERINQLRCGSYTDLREHIIHECTQCTITLEDFSDTTEVIVLPCRHAFTSDGIRRWLQTNTTCPTCRESVLLIDG